MKDFRFPPPGLGEPLVIKELPPKPFPWPTKPPRKPSGRPHGRAMALIAVASLTACAAPHASGTYQTSASYGRLYSAALSVVGPMGYSITSSNKADGLIVASQGVVMGNGTTVGLNVQIADAGGKRTMQVDFTSPPATMAIGGDFSESLARYVEKVRVRIPDLQPTSS